ncbi:bacteriohemerythrin [Kordiimonas marina]|uniref:bacteriohemerythrin n=1 Tax=Kordiimonas marina TaxID=2872312 RepID=UPI001FF6B80A|nr:bacteriohemerythrin [Kordiimonas marina]MCJ9429432.1 bacteriohemerythrin [Kordiimonas marina]
MFDTSSDIETIADGFEVFPWNSNFETGIAAIDNQHKVLVGILNHLAALLTGSPNPDALLKVFDELESYAEFHFTEEEEIWRTCFGDDPRYKQHEKVHGAFLRKISALRDQHAESHFDDTLLKTLEFLTNWLASHILDSDRYMARIVLAVEAGMPLEDAREHATREMSGTSRVLMETILSMYGTLSARTVRLIKETLTRKRVAHDLQVSEQREKAFSGAVVDNVPGLMLLLDGEGRLVRWNTRTVDLTGYDEDELAGKPVAELLEGDQQANLLPSLESLREQGTQDFEIDILLKDGTSRPYQMTGTYLDLDGEDFYIGIGVDISKLKSVEADLRSSRDHYKEAQHLAHLGHWTLDFATREIIWSDEVYNIYGCDPAVWQPTYDKVIARVHPDDVADLERILNRCLQTDGAYSHVHRILMDDGGIKYLRTRGHVVNEPVHGQAGTVKRLVGTVHDISNEKQAEQQLAEKAEEAKAALMSTVAAVAKALEARDPYTAGHQHRVSEIAVAIAEKMGLDAHRIEGIRLGASIHDIGKLAVPAELLTKPSRLSDIEYELIKNHAPAGRDILADIQFPWPIYDIVSQHHERIDGTGYPDGLKGDEICLEARIVAVADVFEAMSAHRPYRAGLGPDRAIEELTRNSGLAYDKNAVDALIDLLVEDKNRFDAGNRTSGNRS